MWYNTPHLLGIKFNSLNHVINYLLIITTISLVLNSWPWYWQIKEPQNLSVVIYLSSVSSFLINIILEAKVNTENDPGNLLSYTITFQQTLKDSIIVYN